MASGDVVVKVTVDQAGVVRGTSESVGIVQRASAAMAAAFARAGQAANGAAGAAAAFSKEQGQQARVVNRLTSELTNLVPMSTEYANVTRGLGGALYEVAAGGLSFGAGLAAVGAAMAIYQAMTKSATEQLQRLQAAQDEGKRRTDAALELLREERILRGQIVYASAEQARQALKQSQTVGDARSEVALLTDQFNAASKALRALEEHEKYKLFGGLVVRASGAKAEVAELARKLAEAQDKYRQLNAEAEKDAARRAGLAQHAGQGFSASAGITSTEVALGDPENRERNRQRDEAAKRAASRYATVEQANAAERTRYNLEKNSFRGGYTNADRERAQAIAAEEEERRQKEARDAARQFGVGSNGGAPSIEELKRHQQEAEKLRKTYERWGDQAGRTIADVITGHKSVGEVMQDLGKQALAMGAKWAISQIMNAALKAGAEGAASSAQAGPPGVIAAPGVMASMIAMVSGLAGSIISSEGGVRLGGGFREQLAVLHPFETVLPREDSETLARLGRESPSGGGGNRYVTQIYALDSKSVFDAIEADPREWRRSQERMWRSGGTR